VPFRTVKGSLFFGAFNRYFGHISNHRIPKVTSGCCSCRLPGGENCSVSTFFDRRQTVDFFGYPKSRPMWNCVRYSRQYCKRHEQLVTLTFVGFVRCVLPRYLGTVADTSTITKKGLATDTAGTFESRLIQPLALLRIASSHQPVLTLLFDSYCKVTKRTFDSLRLENRLLGGYLVVPNALHQDS